MRKVKLMVPVLAIMMMIASRESSAKTRIFVSGYGVYSLHGDIETPSPGGGALLGMTLSDYLSGEVSVTKFTDKSSPDQIPSLSMDVMSAAATLYLSPSKDIFGIKAYCGAGLILDVLTIDSLSAMDIWGARPDMQEFFRAGGQVSGAMDFEIDQALGYELVLGFSIAFKRHWELFANYRYTTLDVKVEMKTHITAVSGGGVVVCDVNDYSNIDDSFNHGLVRLGLNYYF